MRVSAVSGDMVIKLAIMAGAAWGIYYMVGRAGGAVTEFKTSLVNAADAAMNAVTGAVEGPGFGGSGLSGMWINGAYQYDVSAFEENERAAAQAGISAVKTVALPSPDNVAGMFVSAQLAVADWLKRAITPANTPYTGAVPNIEISSWR